MTQAEPSLTIIDELRFGAYKAFAMIAGMNLDVFTSLHGAPATTAQIAESLGVGTEKLRPLLYALVAARLLETDGERFSNALESDQYLVKGKPTYVGGRHQGWANFWRGALSTADSIRTGLPQAKLDWDSMSEDQLANFFRGILANNTAVGQDLMRRHDFTSCRSLVDVGGGSGGIAIGVARAHPHVRATVVEVPNVSRVTSRFVEEAGLRERVTVVAADAVTERLSGPYDVAVMQRFLQVLPSDDALEAVKNVYQALSPGGAIYVYGSIVDDSHLSPLEHALESALNLINSFDHGQPYAEREYRHWLTDAGFEGHKSETLPSNQVCISSRKPT